MRLGDIPRFDLVCHIVINLFAAQATGFGILVKQQKLPKGMSVCFYGPVAVSLEQQRLFQGCDGSFVSEWFPGRYVSVFGMG